MGKPSDGQTEPASVEKTRLEPEASGPVCIVDDDEGVRDSLIELLESYGFPIIAYGSGAEFLSDDRRVHAKCLVI